MLRDVAREAERRVYEALAGLLGPDYCVFYSVAWLTRATGPAARDGEADFVIAHSDLGVLVLEVKGGQIGHDQMTGEWHSTDRHDHRHPIRDPFAQATSSHHALEAKLREHPVIRRFYVRIGHGVVFPDSANPHRPLTPNAEPAITIFAEDLDHIDACVRRMFDYWAGRMSRALAPAPGFVQAVTDLLAPRFELPRSLGATIKGDDRELLRLTEDQFRVLDMLSRQRRVAVSGGAGTGKTMLALEKARRLAAEGLEVLLTCYNRPLADYLRQAAGPCDRLTIANYHTLCWDMAKAAGHPFPDTSVADPPPGFFERILPEALLAALDRLPRRFDAIVVDEGQDFLDSWWIPLMLSLSDREGAILYVFHDDNQKLYRRSNAFPAGMLEIPLRDNLRNTRRISALTEHFYQGPPMRALGPEGQDVERIAIQDASQIEREVSRALHHLIKDNGVAPAHIAVLMGSGRACPLRKGQRIGAFETTTDQAAEPSKVLLETVRRFKGLERPVIILTGIDDLSVADETALLYCGLSRARVHLVIVATETTLERVVLAPSVRIEPGE
ncbi:MAG: NERD domain-containing protein [Vicinamibacterales bacterium]